MVSLNACSKDYSFEKTEGYHLIAAIDGVQVAFSTNSVHHTDPGNGHLYISGSSQLDANGRYFNLGFQINSPDKKITLREYTDSDSDADVFGQVTENNQVSYVIGDSLVARAKANGIIIINHFKVTVTELTKKAVRGTFSGDFYEDGNPGGAIKKITNGKFFLRIG